MFSRVLDKLPCIVRFNNQENVGNDRSAAWHPVGDVLLSAIEIDPTVMGTFRLFWAVKQMYWVVPG